MLLTGGSARKWRLEMVKLSAANSASGFIPSFLVGIQIITDNCIYISDANNEESTAIAT